MKIAVLSLLASLSLASIASASMPQYPNMNGQKGVPNVSVTYLSWCQGNTVVTKQNGIERRVQCEQTRQICVKEEHWVSDVQIFVTANCQYPR